jgi:transcriptional regulator with XRE-family HTH domain
MSQMPEYLFLDTVRFIMNRDGLSVKDVAVKCGVSVPEVFRWFSADRQLPGPRKRMRLAKIMAGDNRIII